MPAETVTITLGGVLLKGTTMDELLRKIWWLMDEAGADNPWCSHTMKLAHQIGLDTVAKRDEVRMRYMDGIKPLVSEE